MAELNKEFIVDLKGKKFVTYNGLIDLAHQMKLKSITTEIIQLPNKENGNQCIIKAVATTEDGKLFEGYGDADPSNINSMIARHLIRMAETRAKARALRDLTNVGMTAIEELSGDEDAEPTTNKSNDAKQPLVDNSLASDAQIKYIGNLMKKKNYEEAAMTKYIKVQYSKDDLKALTKADAGELINMLNGM